MASLYISLGGARALPIELLLASIPSLPRAALTRLVDHAIERLDQDDGDADLEPSGDELDTGNAEDEASVGTPWGLVGLGCPLSDSDLCVDDKGEDDRTGDC